VRALVKPPSRFLFVSHSARRGGAELCLLELCEGLVRLRGAAVHVVLPAPGPLQEDLTAVGAQAEVHRNFGWATARAPRPVCAALAVFTAAASWRLAAKLRRSMPDIVATNSVINPAGAYAARLAHLPHVWLVNEYGDLDHGYHFLLGLRRSLRQIDRLSARVVTCSQALSRRVAQVIPADKLDVAYYAVTHGIDRRPCRPPAVPGAPRVLVLGRKHAGKGQLDALRAIHRVRRRGGRATTGAVCARTGGISRRPRK
jgi:glycosyltransferase involved in cell wall biosynthesis